MKHPEDLMYTMDAANDDDLSDGAWWQTLQDTAEWYKGEYKHSYDSFEAVHAYLEWKREQE